MMSLQYYTYHSIHRVVYMYLCTTTMYIVYVYSIIDAVPRTYMYYDTCMGHACMHKRLIGTTGVPELADCLLLYFVNLASSSHHKRVSQVVVNLW